MNKYYSTTVIYKKVSSMISYLKFLLLYHLIKKILNKYLKYSILNQE